MRVAKIKVSKEILESFLRAEFPTNKVTTNAPKDLNILGIALPVDFQGYPITFDLWCESSEFDEVLEGNEPPTIEPFIYTVHYG